MAIAGVIAVAAVVSATAEPANDAERLLEAVQQIKNDADAWAKLLDVLKQTAVTQPAVNIPDNPEAIEFFETKIRPVFAEQCFQCHGPENQKSDLRLDSRESILKGGLSGPAIVPGEIDGSLILKALAHDSEPKMPPTGKLPEEVIGAIRDWIRMGAPWPAGAVSVATMDDRVSGARSNHWAFLPVTASAPPAVGDPAWVRTDVDAFVLAELEKAGLKPSASADKYTLLRRVTFDLTGLPPTADEVDAFVQDTTPGAYEQVVDRLLASPRYGERWGRYWLDVARYADTRGYVFQSERNIPFSHTYRDFVIRAFNEDLPYDTFVKQQLAADQLELGDDKRPLAAMGFLTLNRHFLGNVHDITDDRIDVVTRGLMGLTVTCARCHDHKFDPISMQDYYALYGVFRSSSEPAELPLIREPDPANPQYQDYVAKLQEAEAAERGLVKELHVDLLAHARAEIEGYMLAAFDTRDITDDEQFQTLARDRSLRWQLVGRWRDYLKKKAEAHDRLFAPWTAFAALPAEGFAEQAAPLTAQFTANADKQINPRVAGAFGGDPPASMADVAKRYATVLHAANDTWMNLLASEAQRGETTPSTALPDADDEAVRQALYGSDSPANIAEGDILPMYDVPTQNRVRDKNNAIARVKASHAGRPDRAMALVDADKPYDPHIFKRGNPQNKGDDVPRQFLAVLSEGGPKPFEKGSGRLELAEAIANAANPLTARVWVNRVWMNHFDRGIVETGSDFGVRTERPVHAALLDYLASRFMHDGWSTKKLHKVILLSNTYQQSSSNNAELRDKDPENRLWWRQNRHRLDFEALRDAVLASSGSLDLTMGGPSVDIVEPPFTARRTVYSYIERQNLPGMFRTFDFASPDTHSARRFRTTVPQQALFMMNSPFVIEQARELASRTDVVAASSALDRAKALYRLVYQREPDADECAMVETFIANQTTLPSRPAPAWQYGYGSVDEAAGRVTSFTAFAHYADREWRVSETMPDPELRYVSLSERGGHAGMDANHASIRRWIAPRDGAITIAGTLKQGEAEGQGDGVIGYVVSNRAGILWKSAVHNTEAAAEVARVDVVAGETIDFVVSCGGTDGFDSFRWAPRLRYDQAVATGSLDSAEWRAENDFSGPQPPPMEPWERYAQVLLASNEFAFID